MERVCFLRSSMEPVVNFCYFSEPQPLHAPSPSLPFERGNLSSGDEEFIFFRATAASSTKTVTEMPTVTSLSKRMKERFVFNCLHTTLSLFSVFLSLHSYHDSPPRCRPRGRHVPRAPCAGRPGEIWRKREQESTVVQARRDRGDDYQGFK